MADARDLKSLGRKAVRVRVPPRVPNRYGTLKTKFFGTALVLFSLVAFAPAVFSEDEFHVSWINEKDYITVKELARVYSARIEGPHEKVLAVANKWNRLVFALNGREATINGTVVWLHEPMLLYRGRWVLRAADVRKVIDPVMRPALYLKNADYRVIVLDPGHGGQDTGAKGRRGVEEKRVVLDIARRVRTQLVNSGYRVYMTREGDRFVELDDRSRKARAWGADLFVSIHVNAVGSSIPAGTETYVLAAAGLASTAGGTVTSTQAGNHFDGANEVLGYKIHKALTGHLNEGDRGVKRARFLVLKDAPCPATLVECAFLSNRRQEEKLLRDDFRQSVADGITRGILNYLLAAKEAKLATP